MTEAYSGVLVYLEQRSGVILDVGYELLRKGREIADELSVLLYGAIFGPPGIAVEEVIFHGADKVYYIANDRLNDPNEILHKNNLLALMQDIKPEICLIGATDFGISFAPRVAAVLNTGLTADCVDFKIDENRCFVQIRPAFSDNILTHIYTDTYPQMATVRYKEFEKADRDPSRTGDIISVPPVVADAINPEILKRIEAVGTSISDAEIVISGGGGLKAPEDFRLLEDLAEALGGMVGASRKIVDLGYISRDRQVGYSGNRVKPKLYIACGISGAPQHLAGMKEAAYIVAINTDGNAPIFKVADLGIIGDLYEIVPAITKALRARCMLQYK